MPSFSFQNVILMIFSPPFIVILKQLCLPEIFDCLPLKNDHSDVYFRNEKHAHHIRCVFKFLYLCIAFFM